MPSSSKDLAQRLNSATVHLMRALRQDPPAGLAAEHRAALVAVVHRGPIPIGALAKSEAVSAPAMTKTVSLLERRGFVTRERDTTDRRLVRIRATRRGAALIARRGEEQVARIERALRDLGPDTATLADTVRTLERLVERLEGERR